MEEEPNQSIKLIKMVRKHPCLYDPRISSYNSKECQDVAWNHVAITMDDSVANVKEKWQNIRRYLNRAQRLSKDYPKVDGRIRKPCYLTSHLAFLRPMMKPRWEDSSPSPVDRVDPLGDVPNEEKRLKVEAPYETGYPEEVRRACVKEEKEVIVVEEEKMDTVEDRKKVADDEPKRRRVGEGSSKGKVFKLEGGGLDTIRINHLDAKNAHISVERRSSSANADMHFFRSLLPELGRMTKAQKSKFRISVLRSLDDILFGDCGPMC